MFVLPVTSSRCSRASRRFADFGSSFGLSSFGLPDRGGGGGCCSFDHGSPIGLPNMLMPPATAPGGGAGAAGSGLASIMVGSTRRGKRSPSRGNG